ncbi:MAG: YraN family protein [Solirubrobacteraceae bacterium]
MAESASTATRDRRRSLGALGEELAASHLRGLGYHVLTRNHRTRHGEIDLIAFDGHTLVFAEVKARRADRARPTGRRAAQAPARGPSDGAFGAGSLGWPARAQRRRLRGLAIRWLHDARACCPRAREIRFDAIGVLIGAEGRLVGIEHLRGAL